MNHSKRSKSLFKRAEMSDFVQLIVKSRQIPHFQQVIFAFIIILYTKTPLEQ